MLVEFAGPTLRIADSGEADAVATGASDRLTNTTAVVAEIVFGTCVTVIASAKRVAVLTSTYG